MKIRLETFCDNLQKFDFKGLDLGFNYYFSDGKEAIWGAGEIPGEPLPFYVADEDRWYSYEEEEDWGTQEIQLNLYQDGLVGFSTMGDIEVMGYNILYNPAEFSDFLKIHSTAKQHILNKEISYKEFKLKDVIEEIFISISTEDSIHFRPLSEIKKQLDPKDFKALISCIFEGDFNFLVNISNWNSFCVEHQLISESNSWVPFHNVPIILFNDVYTNSSPGINSAKPYIGFSIKEGFSNQYLLDFLRQSKDGKILLGELKNCLLNNHSLQSLSISAPNSFIQQIKYSTEFRFQYMVFKNEVTSLDNHVNESINDLKSLYKNRRDNIKRFVFDKNSATILDILRNPLPYNLEKSFRTLVRAGNDLDKLTYAGKLYNLILRSAVFYPLEEIIFLGLDKQHEEMSSIIKEIRGGKPLSDGTWLDFFNRIAAVKGKNNLSLNYFSPFIDGLQKEYRNFQKIISVRNDWAHYRLPSAEFLKTLDEFLPRVLNILRDSLKGNVFLLVENQNYKKDGLYIVGKKIMGYEVDIETVEFKTALEGKHFIKDSLIVYNEKLDYTVPLENFFSVRIVQSEAVQMGIYKGGIGEGKDFEY